jgi:translation initiation factor 1
MASKRIDKRNSGPENVVNPFAEALASALGVDAPKGPGESVLHDDEDANAPMTSKRVEMRFEKKGRNGKMATLLTFDSLGDAETTEWAKRLKQSLGVGGSVEADGQILLQGDVRTKVLSLLTKEGWTVKRIGG